MPIGQGNLRPLSATEGDRKRRDRDNVLAALAATNGKVFGEDGAARLHQIPPTTLLSRMKSLGLK